MRSIRFQCKNEETEETEETTDVIETIGNDIYFFADVTPANIFKLIKELTVLDNTLTKERHVNRIENEIRLFVHSNGGDVFAGLSGMDHISLSRTPVHVIVDGIAASAATFLVVKAHKRSIMPHSRMLIHQISGGVVGKFDELHDTYKNYSSTMEELKSVYTSNAKIPRKILEEMMHKDIEITASECVKYKLVDEILTTL